MIRMIAVFLNLAEVVRYYWNGRVEVIFYTPIPMDEQWLRTTIGECKKRGLSCAAVIHSHRRRTDIPELIKTYYGTSLFLSLIHCKVLVTASSSVIRRFLPRGLKTLVYMPHTLASLHAIYPETSFDDYDVIFASGQHHMEEVPALNNVRKVKKQKVLPVGYGKLDLLTRQYSTYQNQHTSRDSRKTIVIAPSWSKDNILNIAGDMIIDSLLNDGYRVVVRPHPLFFENGDQAVTRLENRFSKREGFLIERSDSSMNSMYEAELMIGDFSGVSMEFAFLRLRPVVFIDVPNKILNPRWADVGLRPLEVSIRNEIGMVVPPKGPAVLQAVAELLSRISEFETRILELRSKYVFNYGHCGVEAANQIENVLKEVEI